MSHELRTPLSAVIGYSEMLAEEIEDLGQAAPRSPTCGKIEASARHLLGLINDVLDLSQDRGRPHDGLGRSTSTSRRCSTRSCAAADAAGRQEGQPPRARRCAATTLGAHALGRAQDPPVPAQPPRQRRQVHRGRRPSRCRCARHRRRRRRTGCPSRSRDTGIGMTRGADRRACSSASSRPTSRPRASSAAPGSASRSPGPSAASSAATSTVDERRRARARPSRSRLPGECCGRATRRRPRPRAEPPVEAARAARDACWWSTTIRPRATC